MTWDGVQIGKAARVCLVNQLERGNSKFDAEQERDFDCED